MNELKRQKWILNIARYSQTSKFKTNQTNAFINSFIPLTSRDLDSLSDFFFFESYNLQTPPSQTLNILYFSRISFMTYWFYTF